MQRVKYRTVRQICEVVDEWKRYQEQKMTDFQIEQKLKIKLRTYWSYKKMIRKGREFGFEFAEHEDSRTGVLKKFVLEKVKERREQAMQQGDSPQTQAARGVSRKIKDILAILQQWKEMKAQGFAKEQIFAQLGFGKVTLNNLRANVHKAQKHGFDFELHGQKRFNEVMRYNEQQSLIKQKNSYKRRTIQQAQDLVAGWQQLRQLQNVTKKQKREFQQKHEINTRRLNDLRVAIERGQQYGFAFAENKELPFFHLERFIKTKQQELQHNKNAEDTSTGESQNLDLEFENSLGLIRFFDK